MKTNKYSVVLGLAALLGTTCLSVTPSLAGGIYGQPVGGMKDSVVVEEGMAIPAPVPMEETATWYIRGDLGFGWGGSDIEESLSLGGGIGYYFTQHVRGDITLEHRTDADIDGGIEGTQPELSNTTLLVNMYYDYHPSATFSPYIGAGIGVAFNELQAGTAGDNSTDFAAMVTTGVNVALRENLFLDVAYRYNYLGDAEATYSSGGITRRLDIDYLDMHELKLGLRYDLY